MELSNTLSYIQEIKQILAAARQKAYAAVNTAMVEAYWLVGKRIVEEEQNGNDRAAYGKEILKTLSIELNKEFGKGYSVTNLQNFRKFYLIFSNFPIQQTPSAISNTSKRQTPSVGSDTQKAKGQTPPDESENLIWRRAFANLFWSHFESLAERVLLYGFANKYLPYLPTEAELAAEIEREKYIIKQQMGL
jgi:hypothetical protein